MICVIIRQTKVNVLTVFGEGGVGAPCGEAGLLGGEADSLVGAVGPGRHVGRAHGVGGVRGETGGAAEGRGEGRVRAATRRLQPRGRRRWEAEPGRECLVGVSRRVAGGVAGRRRPHAPHPGRGGRLTDGRLTRPVSRRGHVADGRQLCPGGRHVDGRAPRVQERALGRVMSRVVRGRGGVHPAHPGHAAGRLMAEHAVTHSVAVRVPRGR